MNYIEKLRQSAKETGSIACMGLDPVVEALPRIHAGYGADNILNFLDEIFIEMNKQNALPGAFKPNHGFYLKHDRPKDLLDSSSMARIDRPPHFSGSSALARIIKEIRFIFEVFECIPVILDYKRGDIATSSANYAAEGFEAWQADAVTVAPYMGTDSVMPFAKYCNDQDGKGVYVLCRTSNKGARDFQDLKVMPNGEELEKLIEENMVGEVPEGQLLKHLAEAVRESSMPVYMAVAHKIVDWAKENPGIGAVVGATYIKEMDEIARLFAGSGVDIPLLIPGVGGQGGSASEVAAVLREAGYDLSLARINSSSGITHPWAKKKEPAPDDYAKVCTAELAKLNEQIGYKA